MTRALAALALVIPPLAPGLSGSPAGEPSTADWDRLTAEARGLGKPEWRALLAYHAGLHRRATRPARTPFPFSWVEIGPGYHARAFGHWDIVHAAVDVMPTLPAHAERQLLNDLANQQADGLVPGVIWVERPGDPSAEPSWSREAGHPPLWPIAVEELARQTRSDALVARAYDPLLRQLGWFEANRSARPTGFYYSRETWESGIDDDLRQPHAIAADGRHWAALDATSHVYNLYALAAGWAVRLGRPAEADEHRERAEVLARFVREELWDPEAGFFYEIWGVREPGRRIESFVAIWPLVVGIATRAQAARVIDEHLLDPERFFGAHPISTIARNAPHFQLLMWRGPAWNSMTFWAARGCVRYGRPDAARRLLERALDDTARQFERTGTVWEFYHPAGGRPEDLEREVRAPAGTPRRDYLGHNPLLAMARLYDRLVAE